MQKHQSGYQPREVQQGPPPLRISDAAKAAEASKEHEKAKKHSTNTGHTGKATQTASTGKAVQPAHTSTHTSTHTGTHTHTASKQTLTPITTTKEKKPWKWKTKHTIILLCLVVVFLAIGIGVTVHFTKNKDTSEPTSVTIAKTPTTTTAPITTPPTTTAPTTTPTTLAYTLGPTPTEIPYTPGPTKTDDHMSKVILYGPDGSYGIYDKLITEMSLYKNDVKISDDRFDLRIYDDINKKIKNLVTKVTLYSENTNQKNIKKIKIKNCKIILNRFQTDLNGKTVYDKDGKPIPEQIERFHYMQDKYEQNDWFEETFSFPNYYFSAIISIMSEVILYNGMGNVIVNKNINNKDITEVIEISDIPFSGFKIRNCTITLYSDTTRIREGDAFIDQNDKIIDETGEVFYHSSKDDNLDENDDSKCYSRKSFAGAGVGYNRIKIVPIRIIL